MVNECRCVYSFLMHHRGWIEMLQEWMDARATLTGPPKFSVLYSMFKVIIEV